MKKLLAVMLILCFALALGGCDSLPDEVTNLLGNSDDVTPDEGYAEGRINDTFKTAFFKFTVTDISYHESVEGFTPKDGKQVVDIVIEVTNTYGEPIPMFRDDFQLQWHDMGQKDDHYTFPEVVASSIPEEYNLGRAETSTYHYYFSAPSEAKEFSVSYMEIYEDQSEGDVFFCYFEK